MFLIRLVLSKAHCILISELIFRTDLANAEKLVAKLPEIYGKMAKNESALASK